MSCPAIRMPTFPDITRRDHEKVADSLRRVVDDIFSHSHPPLRLPIACRVGCPPRASLDSWAAPTEFLIDLDVPAQDCRCDQVAFQLAHEVGHVFVGVYRTNFAIEAIATALSFEALSRLARRWKVAPPYRNWTEYAPRFEEYRRNHENDNIAKCPAEIRNAAAASQWDVVRRQLWPFIEPINTSEADLQGDQGRALQAVAAMALLAQPLVTWPDFIGIESLTVPGPEVNHAFGFAPFSCDLIRAKAPSILWLAAPAPA
jgi:hypothetical protein